MGRIAYHTFAIQLPDYTTVLNLDRELLAWREALPPFFTMDNPDTSLDKDHPYLFVQRQLLACEWYYTRITLNRYVCVITIEERADLQAVLAATEAAGWAVCLF